MNSIISMLVYTLYMASVDLSLIIAFPISTAYENCHVYVSSLPNWRNNINWGERERLATCGLNGRAVPIVFSLIIREPKINIYIIMPVIPNY